MQFISFIVISAWFIFLLYQNYRRGKEFLKMVRELQPNEKNNKIAYIDSKSICAPSWVTVKEIRRFYFWSALKVMAIIFIGLPLIIAFLAGIEIYFFPEINLKK